MILKCSKCGDITDWRDIKKWNRKDKFFCPNCVSIPKIVEYTDAELKAIYDSKIK